MPHIARVCVLPPLDPPGALFARVGAYFHAESSYYMAELTSDIMKGLSLFYAESGNANRCIDGAMRRSYCSVEA